MAEPGGTPETIGPYQVLDVLGEAGMGHVYLAERIGPVRRRVVLKVIKPGTETKQDAARFETERRALDRMNHPGVVRILDAGTTDDGRPYIAIEHVDGVSITEHCDHHKLSIRQRLAIFVRVCHAVQHVHDSGFIHCDIKSTNVLVSGSDSGAVAKVIDFGAARATNQSAADKAWSADQDEFIGTPSYASPEQTETTDRDIDARCDIYSLGVLLYELLTGELPLGPTSLRGPAAVFMMVVTAVAVQLSAFRRKARAGDALQSAPAGAGSPDTSPKFAAQPGRAEQAEIESDSEQGPEVVHEVLDEAAFEQVLHMIREFDPPKPSRRLRGKTESGEKISTVAAPKRQTTARALAGELRGKLDWITMKAMEKDRTRRYATAAALADDIERYVSNASVLARRASASHRVFRFTRRNRALLGWAIRVVRNSRQESGGVNVDRQQSLTSTRRRASS